METSVLLILAAILLPIHAASPPPPPPPLSPLPLWNGNSTITVCTSSYTPMVYCDPETGKTKINPQYFLQALTYLN
jgi:hypothetical protein